MLQPQDYSLAEFFFYNYLMHKNLTHKYTPHCIHKEAASEHKMRKVEGLRGNYQQCDWNRSSAAAVSESESVQGKIQTGHQNLNQQNLES